MAVAKYEECLAFDPFNTNFHATILFNRSSAYQKLDAIPKALEDLDLALKINPAYTKALVKKGDIFMSLERYNEALH